MGSGVEVSAVKLAAGGLFIVVAVGVIRGEPGFGITAPTAAVAVVISAATGCQQQAKR